MIYCASDIHLEFYNRHIIHLLLDKIPSGSILLLAGDIFVPHYLRRTDSDAKDHNQVAEKFFSTVSSKFDHVLLVMGNHEHYHGAFLKTEEVVRTYFQKFPNIRLLEKESVDIGDVTIFGCTLWTDMFDSNPLVMMDAKNDMSDYRYISYSGEKNEYHRKIMLTPKDTVDDNFYARNALRYHLESSRGNTNRHIIMTHHHPFFATPGDISKLDYVYKNTGLEYDFDFPCTVVSGHDHSRVDMKLGDIRFVTNCHGYVGLEPTHDFEFKQL